MIARAQNLCPMATFLSQQRCELERLEQRIKVEEARLPSSARGSTRSHQVVDKELKEAQAKWCVSVGIHTCMHVHTYICTYVYVPMCNTYIVCIHVHVYTYMYACSLMLLVSELCTHVLSVSYVCTYICVHICVHALH